jgi:hypothetical protein
MHKLLKVAQNPYIYKKITLKYILSSSLYLNINNTSLKIFYKVNGTKRVHIGLIILFNHQGESVKQCLQHN